MLNLTSGELAQLFPAFIEVDPSLEIMCTGPSLSSHFEGRLKGRALLDVFVVERPFNISDSSSLRECSQALILRSKCGGKHRLRGIVLDRCKSIFLIVAHIPELGDETEGSRYTFEDFSPTDGTLDMLLALELRSGLLADARQMAEKLEKERLSAERASRAKTSFLATMSHEIRTPMNGILGLASILTETHLTSDQRELVSTMIKSGETLMNILSNVLDLSKIEAGSLELEDSIISLSDLVDGVYSLFQPLANAKGLKILTNICVENDLALGDPTRVRQIVTNLVSNAIKFTEDGTVSLRIRDWEDGERHVCEITVSDTGIGMPEEAVDNLFQPFNQADSSTTRRFGGSGLGLAISKRLCESMGGSVHVESRVGRGTNFIVNIPFAIPSADDMAKHCAYRTTQSNNAEAARSPSVLVVEDNATNRLVISKFLERLNVKHDFAHDGVQALTAWEEGDYTIIFMDIQMPNLDGIEATRELRRRERALGRKHTNIVGLSADVMLERRDEALAVGMDSFLTKPIRLAELEVVINPNASAN